jgi:hypothetical protein
MRPIGSGLSLLLVLGVCGWVAAAVLAFRFLLRCQLLPARAPRSPVHRLLYDDAQQWSCRGTDLAVVRVGAVEAARLVVRAAGAVVAPPLLWVAEDLVGLL